MAYVNLEKAFDRELRKLPWWALRVACVLEWLVIEQAIYVGARSGTLWFAFQNMAKFI